MKEIYSSGEVATMLDISRDKVQNTIKSQGAPQPSMRLNKHHAFTPNDVVLLYEWLVSKGEQVSPPPFSIQSTA